MFSKKNDIITIERQLDSMYDVSDVKVGFRYWFFKLLNITLDLFTYKGLPEGLPAREIELNLQLTGHAIILQDKKASNALFNPITCIFGFDKYYNPTNAVFGNNVVVDSHEYTIGKDCEVIYNNMLKDSILYIPSDGSLMTFISRYARQLADIESTINIYSVNSRLTSIPVTDDQNVTHSIKAFFKKLAIGERAVVTDNNIIENFRNVDVTRTNIVDGINDWIIARDKVLEMFYRDIGLKMYNPKKAQVTNDEIEANTQILLISTDDMLKERREGIERVNAMFGTSISVDLNEKYKTERSEADEENTTVLYE